ncbi:MAG: carbohydrate-binding protein [Chitinophagaceae bacterium]
MKDKTLPSFIRVVALMLFSLLAFNYSFSQTHTPKYVSMAGAVGGYYEYLPQGYSGSTATFPLILFIHGLGDQGDGSSQLSRVLRNGVAKRIHEGGFPSSFTVNGVTSRFVVITPQFNRWPRTTDVDEVLNYIVSHYRIDLSRIYITGFSMGGGATWEYVGTVSNLNNIQRVAAIAPVAGASTPTTTRARNIAKYNLPVWAFHNSNDPDVSVSNTTTYVERINQAPAPTPAARMTIFNASGHDAWTRAYDPAYKENGKNVYEWMLQYSRGGTPPPAENIAPVANAGTDRSITLPTNSVSLSGSGADQDGTISAYAWTKTAGPAQYSISNTNVSNPTISQLTAGTYTFRLTVTDNKGATGFDDVNVVVSAAPVTNQPVPGKIEAESYSKMQGIQTEATSDADGGSNVGWVESGDWMDYNVSVAGAGSYIINFRVATTAANNEIQLRRGDGTVLAATVLPNTGGWQNWTTVSATVNLAQGNQVLRIYAPTGGFNLNWFEFSSNSGTSTPATTRYIRVNIYGGSNAYSHNEWNNWVASTYSGNLKYSNGTGSSISATLSNAGTVSDNGSSYPGGIAPAQVLRHTTYATANRTLTISGLDPGKTYSLELFASRAMNANNSTIFALGGATQTVSTYYNSNQSARFSNHRPDANGRLVVNLSKSGAYNYLNGFVLTENGAQSQSSRGTAPETGIIPSAEIDNSNDRTIESREGVRLYPNPFRSQVFLEINNEETGTMQITIVDFAGKIHRQYQINKPQKLFNQVLQTGDLPEGMYMMRIQIGKWSNTQKILHTRN